MTRWVETIRLGDVFHNDALTFEQRRDAIVARLRASRWYADSDSYWGLHDCIDMLECQDNTDGFDYEWENLYDMADWDKVWIDTITTPVAP